MGTVALVLGGLVPGLGVVFGMALFQVLLVLMTALPVWKAIRTEGSGGHATEGTEHRDD